jgi:hypothetical protein
MRSCAALTLRATAGAGYRPAPIARAAEARGAQAKFQGELLALPRAHGYQSERVGPSSSEQKWKFHKRRYAKTDRVDDRLGSFATDPIRSGLSLMTAPL